MRTLTALALVLACFLAEATCTNTPNPLKGTYTPVKGSYTDADWSCWLPQGDRAGSVQIWWGFTAADATWACNKWNSRCGNVRGGCKATPLRKYACLCNGGVVDTVSIWWGYTDGDAAWACNKWSSRCSGAQGGCTAARSLDYVCLKGGAVVDTVSIWWGYADGDAAWACNKWNSRCYNACTARVATPKVPAPVPAPSRG
jgi:hypothetical protein